MSSIHSSAAAFEDWQRGLLGPLFVEADLDKKHRKMRKGVFPFLRATYWRWAETVFDILPPMRNAAGILAIGDTHLENFGTWRDAEGRLVWGANDFDDACVMPWPLDLVRLATSAILAAGEDADAAELCRAIWDGYRAGLAAPAPILLERDLPWLRKALLLGEEDRKAFWKNFDKPGEVVPPDYAAVLRLSLPDGNARPEYFARQAGTGSLGRPRFVARLDPWRGGPVLREAKGVLPSAWSLFHKGGGSAGALMAIANGAFRSPDPHFQIHGAILVRRLSPSSRKIEVDEKGRFLLDRRMLELMGREIANCHAGDGTRMGAVRDEVEERGDPWLEKDARAMARAVSRDQRDF